MRVAVEVAEEELADLKAFTHEADATAALRAAVIEYLRYARRMQLKAASGHVTIENNWQSLENAETRGDGGGKAVPP